MRVVILLLPEWSTHTCFWAFSLAETEFVAPKPRPPLLSSDDTGVATPSSLQVQLWGSRGRRGREIFNAARHRVRMAFVRKYTTATRIWRDVWCTVSFIKFELQKTCASLRAVFLSRFEKIPSVLERIQHETSVVQLLIIAIWSKSCRQVLVPPTLMDFAAQQSDIWQKRSHSIGSLILI